MSAQRQALPKPTGSTAQRQPHSHQNSPSKTRRKPHKVPVRHARTTGWWPYKPPITSHSPLLQPILDDAATVGVSQARKPSLISRLRRDKCCSHSAPLTSAQAQQQEAPRRTIHSSVCSLPSKRQHRPTLPVSAMPQHMPVPDSASVCSTVSAEPRLSLRYVARWSLYASHLALASLILHSVSALLLPIG